MIERWRMRIAAAALTAAGTLLAQPGALAQGCAMCQTAIGGQDDPLSRGISYSVIFMIFMPFTVFFAGAAWLYLTHRKAKRVRAAEREAVRVPVTAANELVTGGV